MSSSLWDRLLTATLVVAAVAVAGSTVHREFFAPSGGGGNNDAPPVYVKSWENLERSGELIGDSAARVRIIEFADLECGYCKMFQGRLDTVKAMLGKDVAVIFIHFPLAMHRFARPAARAAECAREQQRFGEFVAAVYRFQDSLGVKSWASIAADAGVKDTARLGRCASGKEPVPRIEEGVATAARANVTVTPTVIVNGWKFTTPPSEEALVKIAKRLQLYG